MIVTFPMKSNPNVSLLAWTTTPWTLPSNLALCVNENLVYVKIKGTFFMVRVNPLFGTSVRRLLFIPTDVKKNKMFILMKARLDYVYKSEDDYQIVEEFLGFQLKGEKYEPIFPYFSNVSILHQIKSIVKICALILQKYAYCISMHIFDTESKKKNHYFLSATKYLGR